MESTLYNLKNKQILISGASSGIGRQIAIDASKLGANLIITGRNKKNLEETFKNLEGKQNRFFVADLTKQSELNELINYCDKIDGLVHSAGITENRPIKFIEEKYMDNIMDINYKAPVLLTSKLLKNKKINKNSSIVFISSISSKYTAFGTAIYSSSKAGIEAFSKTLALELSNKKIRSNSVLPAFVETELLENVKKTIDENSLNNFKNILPLGFGKAQDVSNTVIFLLSDKSNWITGQEIKLGAF